MAPLPTSNHELRKKLFAIVDLKDEVAELATQLATKIGGDVAYSMEEQEIFGLLCNDDQIILLEQKQDALNLV